MLTANYLMMLGVGSVLALLLAFATHAGHAYLAVWPDLYWNWQLRRRSPEGRYNWADYDEEGRSGSSPACTTTCCMPAPT